ncbi:MAG: nickel pincer cofactor biosynthesis protein LarC [Candidatus Dormibacteria bacterium]
MRAAYFDCLSGASGNMVLGALLDAGASRASVDTAIAALGLAGAASLVVERRQRGGIGATHVEVTVTRPQAWTRVSEIDRIIAEAPLDEGVRERSRLAFRLLGDAEARAHGVSVDDVHLHEVGAVDAVVDVVGSFAAADDLGIEAFYASALPYCEGETTSAHGVISLPAPATLLILEAAGAATYRKDGGYELVTPTGAAIIAACATFESPRLELEREGFGAGTAELPWPNVLRVAIGEVATPAEAVPTAPDAGHGLRSETVAILETNIDDMAPSLLADLPRAMLEAGAIDAFLTPVVMKKGRAAHLVTVVCAPEQAEMYAERLVRQSTTLGVRIREERRLVADRRIEAMESDLGVVSVKLKLIAGEIVDAVPEHDDVVAAAVRAGIEIVEAQHRLHLAARRQYMGES